MSFTFHKHRVFPSFSHRFPIVFQWDAGCQGHQPTAPSESDRSVARRAAMHMRSTNYYSNYCDLINIVLQLYILFNAFMIYYYYNYDLLTITIHIINI